MTLLGPNHDHFDANYRDATRAFTTTSLTGESIESHDLCLISTGLPIGDFNLVFPKKPDDPTTAVDRALGYFHQRSLPFRVVVRSDLADTVRGHAIAAGLIETTTIPGMRIDELPDGPTPPSGLSIRHVSDSRGLTDFQQTAFGGFGLPTELSALFLSDAFLALPNAKLLAGYVDGEPCVSGALVTTGSVAGVYWIATLPDFRGRGFGEAMTAAVLDAGRMLGCTVGSLQASEMGRGVYERMGFRQDREYVCFDTPLENPTEG